MKSRQAATEILIACVIFGGFGFFYGISKDRKKAIPFGIVGLICVLLNIVGWPIAIFFAYKLFVASALNSKSKKSKKNKVGGLGGLF